MIRNTGYVFIGGMWSLLILLSIAIFFEYSGGIALYQYFRYGEQQAVTPDKEMFFLRNQYGPFTVQYLHPFYLFSFPLSLSEREAINNETVSIGPSGFRGTGPEEAGGKKLAFLTGGSSTFGHFATSNETTISGYLNQMQEQYHFVNAGVPSWNTTQELHRLVDEILLYDPALIISFGGWNDAMIARGYIQQNRQYLPGTPESFDRLDDCIVDNIHGVIKDCSLRIPILERLFPEVYRHGRNMWRQWRGLSTRLLSEKEIEQLTTVTAQKYLNNIQVMTRASSAFGSRFLAILQPSVTVHNKQYAAEDSSQERKTIYQLFRKNVLAQQNIDVQDFTDIFDTINIARDPEGYPERRIFADRVHLMDYGNELIAKHILALLKGQR